MSKITGVRAIALEAPLDPSAQVTAFGPRPKAAMLLVEIMTSDGVVGYGEALARYSLRAYVAIVEDVLAPRLVGRDPFHVEGLWQELFRTMTGKSGGILIEALSACDIALWDVMGKTCGQPVHKLLGSCGAERVHSYASSISWAEESVAAAQTARAIEAGFDTIKIKIGPPVHKALERAAFIRSLTGDNIDLAADANWAFDHDDALRVGRGLADLGYIWFEEPTIAEDVEGYARLRPQLGLRLAAGESEHTVYGCRTLISSGGVGVIQPDPARAGGITETRRIGMLAYAFNVAFAPHIGFCGAICAAASLHLSASLPNFLTYEAMIFDNPLRQKLTNIDVTNLAFVEASTLPVPEGPGLGVELDLSAVEHFRIN